MLLNCEYMADGREYLGSVSYMLAYSFMLRLPHIVSSYHSQGSGIDKRLLVCSMAATFVQAFPLLRLQRQLQLHLPLVGLTTEPMQMKKNPAE